MGSPLSKDNGTFLPSKGAKPQADPGAGEAYAAMWLIITRVPSALTLSKGPWERRRLNPACRFWHMTFKWSKVFLDYFKATSIFGQMKARQLSGVLDELCFGANKMAFVSGPRQCGKTTLARSLLASRGRGAYHNWDEIKFRREWAKDPAATLPAGGASVPLVVYDEIHKAKGWKRAIKGIFDTLESRVDILVTGSARLNVYRRQSDSLVGRYHHFRLHPFTVGELAGEGTIILPDELLERIDSGNGRPQGANAGIIEAMMRHGPFPEPLLAQSDRKTRLWQRTRIERVIREDLRDLSRIQELSQVEMLAALLPERVGSPVSVATFQGLLEVSHPTVKSWLAALRELYLVYELKPYSKRIARSLHKEGKYYMWDFGEVPDAAARFENLIGSHLLKACHLWTDMGEGAFELCYLRNKEKQEIDFLIVRDRIPWLPVEVKIDDPTPSPNWRKFLPQLPCRVALQTCLRPGVHKVHQEQDRRLVVVSAADLLACLP